MNVCFLPSPPHGGEASMRHWCICFTASPMTSSFLKTALVVLSSASKVSKFISAMNDSMLSIAARISIK